MNEYQKQCLIAYSKLTQNTIFKKSFFLGETFANPIGNLIMHNHENDSIAVNSTNHCLRVIFRHKNNLDGYNFNSVISFANVNKKVIATVFKNNNYNYQLIHETIQSFYNLGKQYGLFEEISELKNIDIENTFKAGYRENGKPYHITPSETNIADLTLSDFFKTAANTTNGKLRKKRISIYYTFPIKNNEVHPIAHIEIPVSMDRKHKILIDIHPENKELNEKNIQTSFNTFDQQLRERIDLILKKELKMDKNLLESLKLEEKLEYLKVAEMVIV